MRSLRSLCVSEVSRKSRCRNSDVRERSSLKEDIVTRVKRGCGGGGKGLGDSDVIAPIAPKSTTDAARLFIYLFALVYLVNFSGRDTSEREATRNGDDRKASAEKALYHAKRHRLDYSGILQILIDIVTPPEELSSCSGPPSSPLDHFSPIFPETALFVLRLCCARSAHVDRHSVWGPCSEP
ncbi:hypothetical protein EVAR_8409_1 [Eumeta japonica]|uniref:Uncharacterized protein n=1 Tax=Eumeta variegata TaxID=151549 RepID=A0A4C1WCK0_EUMVA|nr:hypothetical protein EVAR_8409_1 [Eumeta japonica]